MSNVNLIYRTTWLLTVASLLWTAWNYFLPETVPATCLFRHATGIKCPSCGTTASVMEIFQGNFVSAFLNNPIGYVAIILLSFVPGLLVYDLVSGRRLFYEKFILVEKYIKSNKLVYMSLIVLVICNWIFILRT